MMKLQNGGYYQPGPLAHAFKNEIAEVGDGDKQGTPLWFFLTLQHAIGCTFEVDLFASHGNALCREYYTADRPFTIDDVQRDRWYFANPPYSASPTDKETGLPKTNISQAMKTCYEIFAEGGNVVALHRFDPSSTWFQDYCPFHELGD